MARKEQENPQLDMTPMIDVVFELIIFFVVTIKSEDLFSRLNANRPAPSTGNPTEADNTSVTIAIGRGRDANGAIVYNGREIKRRSSSVPPPIRRTRRWSTCWTSATATSFSA